MAYITLFLAIVFAFMIALFAVQNSMMVNVTMLKWNVEASLVMVILAAASLGFLTAFSLHLYVQVRLRYQLYKAQSRIKQLEQELVQCKPPVQPEQTDKDSEPKVQPGQQEKAPEHAEGKNGS